ncbi:DUF4259 domain-containing protein [Polymorphospora sp. NPDC051019]|uniref:DUF4259 domain-containing protein n=1 Tax=Polymorphospora sp. NPDC051019 TaxID=3155725 RepID=UPI003427937E
MGTWDIGPFDNDSAADWSGRLHDAAPAERAGIVERALRDVETESGYLDCDVAADAVAAAAVVASQLPGGPKIESAYAPDFLTGGESLPLPEHLPALAVRALDRIVADESEWRDLWADSGALDKAVAELGPIRVALDRRGPLAGAAG